MIAANGAQKSRLLLLCFLVALVLPIEFKLGSLLMSPVRAVLMIAIVPYTINLFAGKYGKVLLVDILFFAHIFWVAVCLWVNNPNRVFENAGSSAIEFLGAYLIARSQVRTRDDFIFVIKVLAILIAALLPLAIMESVLGRRMIIDLFNMVGMPTVNRVDIERRIGLARVQGPFAHPIHFGLFCSLNISLLYFGLQRVMTRFWRIVSTAITAAAVFFSLSSGALLAMFLQVGLFAWAIVLRPIRIKWLLLFLCFVAAYVVVDIFSNRTPLKVFMSYATFSPHNAYYRSITNDYAMQNVWKNPIFGLGLKYWPRPLWMYSGSIDNFWLVMAVRFGFPGAGAVILGYTYVIIKIGFKKLSNPIDIDMRLAWMITFSGLLFTLTTVHVWSVIYSFVFFFFGTGIWLITAPQEAAEPAGVPGGRTGVTDRVLRYNRPRPAPEAVATAATVAAETIADADAGNSPPPPRYGAQFARQPTKGPDSPARDRAPRHTRFARPGVEDKG